MRRLITILFGVLPVLCYGQVHVGPDGYMLYVFWALAVAVLLALLAVVLVRRMPATKSRKSRNPEIHLIGNRSEKPDVLTLFIVNQTGKSIEFNSPILEFKKWFKTRKFKLKGSKKGETYPFRLESGREYELQINLDVFHKHDSTLMSYPQGRITIESITGQRYKSKYIRLRK